MEMDAIAAANTAVFAMSIASCIAMLVAGMEKGRALLALPASHDLSQGFLMHVHHDADLSNPSKALATNSITIGAQDQKWPLLRHTHATGMLGGALQGMGLVISSGMAVCILHALLTYLPLCFTIGKHSMNYTDMSSCATQSRSVMTAHADIQCCNLLSAAEWAVLFCFYILKPLMVQVRRWWWPRRPLCCFGMSVCWQYHF